LLLLKKKLAGKGGNKIYIPHVFVYCTYSIWTREQKNLTIVCCIHVINTFFHMSCGSFCVRTTHRAKPSQARFF
jgi:hypothetical protein